MTAGFLCALFKPEGGESSAPLAHRKFIFAYNGGRCALRGLLFCAPRPDIQARSLAWIGPETASHVRHVKKLANGNVHFVNYKSKIELVIPDMTWKYRI